MARNPPAQGRGSRPSRAPGPFRDDQCGGSHSGCRQPRSPGQADRSLAGGARWCWAAGRSWLSCRVPGCRPSRAGHLPRWLVSREASPRAGSRMGPPGRASAPVVGSVSGRPSPQPGPARRRSGPPPAAGSATTTSARHGRPPSLPDQLLVQLLQAGPLLLGPRSRAAGVVQPGGREAGPGHLIGRPA